jgi:hypothetical protein
MALMTGTTPSPFFTARVPPARKQFCTSTTINALVASGFIFGVRADAHPTPLAAQTANAPDKDRKIVLRFMTPW